MPKRTVTIRVATDGDVDQLAEVREEMDAEDGVPVPDGFRELFAEWYREHGSAFTIVVAQAEGRLIGTIWLERVERVPRPSEPRPAAVGYVTFTFVRAEYRNTCVGSGML